MSLCAGHGYIGCVNMTDEKREYLSPPMKVAIVLFREKKAVSLRELAAKMRLGFPYVSKLVDKLYDAGIVVAKWNKDKKAGKWNRTLSISSESYKTIGELSRLIGDKV